MSQHELASPDAEVQIPIAGIESKRNEAIVDFAYGVGLSFYFDGPDRMYVQVPLAGKLYYRRVKDEAGSGVVAHLVIPSRVADAPAVVSHPPTVPVETNSSSQPPREPRESEKAEPPYKIAIKQGELSMARGNLEAAGTYFASASADQDAHPMIDYDFALLKLRQGDQDAAIRHLGDAFAKGFRGFDVIAQDASFDPIKSDVRFNALVSRYR
ncbi:TPR end-of-group domain-containing protein [Caballeronia sp. M23-90]